MKHVFGMTIAKKLDLQLKIWGFLAPGERLRIPYIPYIEFYRQGKDEKETCLTNVYSREISRYDAACVPESSSRGAEICAPKNHQVCFCAEL